MLDFRRFLLVAGLVLWLFGAGGSIAAEQDDYLLGEGDILRISVYDHADLSLTARVGGDGTIAFPLIGQVEIRGLTATAAAEKIARLLSDGYIVNPQVSVFIEQFRNRKVVIMGEVSSPGLYELSGPTTLLELISRAGGLSREAGPSAAIHRQSSSPGDPDLLQIDLKKLLEQGDRSQDVVLRDGDNIFIAKAGLAYVTGQVQKPDSYPIEEGTTVIMAVTRAGGFTPLAAKGRVKVIRKVSGEEQIFEKVPMNMPVLPDDVIVVPESYF